MTKPTLHLICNAHLDPVWLWEWEEGAAEAISTFRVAADLCEEFDGFVFNHNEVILYEWVEEYEPELFKRIQRLVKEGRWHIMGGWYLQPDCNMPSGESFVRQILLGRRYFERKFGVRPTTAINFDPFGHSQGLVQILAKSGFDSYLFCRPGCSDMKLERDEFVWRGYDGSEILATRVAAYNTPLGKAVGKIEEYLETHNDFKNAAFAWGVGNHGGGPSRADLRELAIFASDRDDVDVNHSTPDKYFRKLAEERGNLAVRDDDLNSWAIGCYTSQIELKQRHRELENELYATEKMLSNLWRQSRIDYPSQLLSEAVKDLCHAEFHDILPGSSIQPVEKTSLRLMDHGLEILSRLKAKAFFALGAGQPVAKEGVIPILVHNPHPYPVEMDVECEFQLADQNWDDDFTACRVIGPEGELPTQNEKEASNLNLDWRKRIVFRANLAASRTNRFDCELFKVPTRPVPNVEEQNGVFSFDNGTLSLDINAETGLIDRYEVNGCPALARNAFLPLVIADNEDPWGMQVRDFREIVGEFKLMTPEESAKHAGVRKASLPPVRVVEQGAVRTVVESSLRFGDSFLLLTYRIPNVGTEIEVEVRVTWNEKDKMLKLAIPAAFEPDVSYGQTAFGFHELAMDGTEQISQKWQILNSMTDDMAVRVVNNGIYGCDIKNREIRITLLRSPSYSGHPIGERDIVMQDRFTPRSDQGERTFKFWLGAGSVSEMGENADRSALNKNETPMALSFFPGGGGDPVAPGPMLTGDITVIMTACKKAEDDDSLLIRLFNASAKPADANLTIPGTTIDSIPLAFSKFEVKSLLIDVKDGKMVECDMIENRQ